MIKRRGDAVRRGIAAFLARHGIARDVRHEVPRTSMPAICCCRARRTSKPI
jgi:hypothetical protein